MPKTNNYVKAPKGFAFHFFDDTDPESVRRAYEWAELQTFPLQEFVVFSPLPYFSHRGLSSVLSIEEMERIRVLKSWRPWTGIESGRPRN